MSSYTTPLASLQQGIDAPKIVFAEFTFTVHPEDHRWKPPSALAEFVDLRRWVAWRNDPNAGKRPTKVPYRSIGRKASSSDAKTWRTLAEAEAVAQAPAFLREYGLGGGIGLMLGGLADGVWLIGIDLDACRDAGTGDITPWATEVIERLGSYTEVSPSKTGAKVFARVASSDLPEMRKILGERAGAAFKQSGGEHPPAIEVFSDLRYFAVTGWCQGNAEMRTIPVADFRWLIEEAGPRLAGKSKTNGHDKSRDASRSAVAFRKCAALRRQGRTFEEMIEDLRADPETAEWVEDKGERDGQRELRRIWDKVGDTDEVVALIERFNNKFLMVNENGRAVIYQPGYDPVLKRRRFDRLTTRDLLTLYMNEMIQVGTDDRGRAVYKNVADVWLRHKDRKQFLAGITFDPADQTPSDVLNLWRGYAIEPVAGGDWTLLQEHILAVVCAGDTPRYNYLIQWIARLFQHPAEQGEVAVVMKGSKGSGKGTLAKVLLRIVGHHGIAISQSKHLTGNFNMHLRDAVLLFADEAFFAGDRQHIGALNSLITEPYLTIEGKYANAYQAPNFLHVIMASNEDWVVPASLDERRHLVLNVSDEKQQDHAYFGAIWKQMEAGGYSAMLHDLLAMDLSDFNVRDVPNTDGLQDQRKLSLPVPEQWWQDILHRGYVFRSKLGLEAELGTWLPEVSTELLFASYEEFSKQARERRPMSRESLGRFMAKMTARPKRLFNAPVGEHLADVLNHFGGSTRKAEVVIGPRPPGYVLGGLQQARAAFRGVTGLDVAWQDEDDAQMSAAHICLPYLYPRLNATTVDSRVTVTKIDSAELLDRLSARIERLAPPAAIDVEPAEASPAEMHQET